MKTRGTLGAVAVWLSIAAAALGIEKVMKTLVLLFQYCTFEVDINTRLISRADHVSSYSYVRVLSSTVGRIA